MTSDRRRLDEELVARGLVASRSRARDLVLRGLVRVGAQIAAKPSLAVRAADAVTVDETAAAHVSRGAEKLIGALDAFGLDPKGRTALDVGASSGGFTEVLLARGAAKVYAVDVGHGQLHPRLAADARVVSLESCDARSLDTTLVPAPVTAIVSDVSFISLTLALPAALRLSAPGCWLAALIKPQFESGRDAVGKGGIVRDATARDVAVARVRDWLAGQPGWRVLGVVDSPIEGGSGNREFLIGAVNDS